MAESRFLDAPGADGFDDTCTDVGALLGRIADEIGAGATLSLTLQGSLSDMLARLDHPDLGGEIHMLQEIDRLHQTLDDLSALLSALGTGLAGRDAAPLAELHAVLKLESLRHRLLASSGPDHPGEAEGSDGIHWL